MRLRDKILFIVAGISAVTILAIVSTAKASAYQSC
jgi:hypothetical protein